MNKTAEMIDLCKEAINEFVTRHDGNDLRSIVDTTVANLEHGSILAAVAFRTVIESGTFIEDLRWGWRFNMPSTYACLKNFKACKKSFNRGEKIKFFDIPAEPVEY